MFTGLRPGEKLARGPARPGRSDERPCHPLISQVPVPELGPGEVAGLDADADPVSLRQVLAAARLRRGPCGPTSWPCPPALGSLVRRSPEPTGDGRTA